MKSGKSLSNNGNEPGITGTLLGKSGKVVFDTGKLVGKTGKLLFKSGNLVRNTGELVRKTGKVVCNTGDVVGNTGKVVSDTGYIVRNTGNVPERPATSFETPATWLATPASSFSRAAISFSCVSTNFQNQRRTKMDRKITTELQQFKKLGRMCDFGTATRDRLAPGTPAAESLAALTTTVSDLKAATASQASLKNRLRELRRARLAASAALRDDMESIYYTAQAIARQQPGFDDRFQISLFGDTRMLTAARSALKDAAPVADVFVKHAMAPDFLDTLKSKIQKLEQARAEYANGKTARTVGQGTLEESLHKGLAAGSGFDAIIRNTFRDEPVTLAAWDDACRGPRPSLKKKPDAAQTAQHNAPQPTPPPPPQAHAQSA